MPYKRRTRRRRARKGRRRKKTTSFGKKLLRDARTSRIDSAAEKAVQIIAKREAAKLLPSNLIHRRFWFANYNPGTNLWTAPTNIDRDGIVVSLAQIPIMDNATQPVAQAVNQVLDPSMRPNPTYVYGQNVIAPQRAEDGYRRGSEVLLKNINILLKVWVDKLGLAPNVQPEFENVTLTWHVIAVTEAFQIQVVAGHTPAYRQLIRTPTWGYSSRLDARDLHAQMGVGRSVLMKGSTTFRFSQDYMKDAMYSKFHKFSGKGLKISYFPGDPANLAVADLYGQQVESDSKLYFCVRSNVDPGVNGMYKPRLAMCCKLGYVD